MDKMNPDTYEFKTLAYLNLKVPMSLSYFLKIINMNIKSQNYKDVTIRFDDFDDKIHLEIGEKIECKD